MKPMKLGKLEFKPAKQHLNLVAVKTKEALQIIESDEAYVAEIDPDLADTSAFCEHYDIDMDVSANCVIVEAKRGDKVWYAACIILATDRADINGVVRKTLDARRVSFAPMETAVSLSSMEYGGITPIGLPKEWPILVDTAVASSAHVVVGSGIRGSKVVVSGELLASLPGARVLDITQER